MLVRGWGRGWTEAIGTKSPRWVCLGHFVLRQRRGLYTELSRERSMLEKGSGPLAGPCHRGWSRPPSRVVVSEPDRVAGATTGSRHPPHGSLGESEHTDQSALLPRPLCRCVLGPGPQRLCLGRDPVSEPLAAPS